MLYYLSPHGSWSKYPNKELERSCYIHRGSKRVVDYPNASRQTPPQFQATVMKLVAQLNKLTNPIDNVEPNADIEFLALNNPQK